MSGPVTRDDLVQGAVKYLLAQPSVLAVLGTTDAGTPRLFQYELFGVMEGTGSTAAVIGRGGGWDGGNEHNTTRFPRLTLELWADPMRDVTKPGEVWRRIDAALDAFDRVLHRPQGGEQWWGTVRTISCVRGSEPLVYPVPDGDGLLRGIAYYFVEQG